MDYIELKIEIEPYSQDTNDIVVAQLADMGFESFADTETGLCAYIKAPDYTMEKESMLKDLLLPEGVKIKHQIDRIKGENWNAKWESDFEPIVVDARCMVRASFHRPISGMEYDIVIDPKMSFGTGHHQTTHLMIQAILNNDFTSKIVLDMGCGTGVLAILAEMRGAKSVTAIDNDEWAYNNSLENIEVNKCKRVEAICGDAKQIEGKLFDIILANINLNILLNDIPHYVKSLNPKGTLILSGILKSNIQAIQKRATEFGLSHLNTSTRDEWVMMSFQKL